MSTQVPDDDAPEMEENNSVRLPMVKGLCRIDFYTRTGKMVPGELFDRATLESVPGEVPEVTTEIIDLPLDLHMAVLNLAGQLVSSGKKKERKLRSQRTRRAKNVPLPR